MAAATAGGSGAGDGDGDGDGDVPAATRLQAYAWCREFLAGSWKLIGPEEFGIGLVRYELIAEDAAGGGDRAPPRQCHRLGGRGAIPVSPAVSLPPRWPSAPPGSLVACSSLCPSCVPAVSLFPTGAQSPPSVPQLPPRAGDPVSRQVP